MKHHLVNLACFFVLLASMLMGIFAAAGVCVGIFGPKILEINLGDSPDRSHPAFWVFMLITIPGMIIGGTGAIFGFIVPAHCWLGLRFSRSHQSTRRLLYKYSLMLMKLTEPDQPKVSSEAPDRPTAIP